MRKRPILTGWKEIAEFLGVHIETAQRWAKEEGLPITKIGGKVLSSKNAIEIWLLKNKKSVTYEKN